MKPIPGFEAYSATENGDIYRTNYSDEANKARYALPHRLTPSKDRDGYLRVILCVSGRLHYMRVNRLIAVTFLPNENDLPLVNHKDGDKGNNSLDNLEWVTHKENVLHAHHTHLHKGCRTAVILTNGDCKLEFPSITEAADYLNHSRDCFRRHLTEDSRHGAIDDWKFELRGGKERRGKEVVPNEDNS